MEGYGLWVCGCVGVFCGRVGCRVWGVVQEAVYKKPALQSVFFSFTFLLENAMNGGGKREEGKW